jgi:pimeloyl-ACP methyl ester carboxylesterase
MDGTGLMLQRFRTMIPANVPVTVVRYPARERHSFMELVEIAERQLAEHRPWVVVGESFSGAVAVELCRRAHRDIRALVLCVTFARSPLPSLRWLLGLLPVPTLLRLPVPDMVLRQFCVGHDAPPALLEQMHHTLQAVAPEVLADRLAMIASLDIRDRLAALRLPCLYIQADADRLVPAGCLQPFREAIPRLQVRQVAGPHFLMESQPHGSWSAISDFIAGLPAEALT